MFVYKGTADDVELGAFVEECGEGQIVMINSSGLERCCRGCASEVDRERSADARERPMGCRRIVIGLQKGDCCVSYSGSSSNCCIWSSDG